MRLVVEESDLEAIKELSPQIIKERINQEYPSAEVISVNKYADRSAVITIYTRKEYEALTKDYE